MVPEIWRATEFFILNRFLPFYRPTDPENQNFEIKKTPTYIIVLHNCTINDNHIMYGSCDMEQDGHNFCNFGKSFALLHH